MNAELLREFRPARLVHIESPITASNGMVLVEPGLIAVKLYKLDPWGAELISATTPDGNWLQTFTVGDLEQAGARFATADEERAWLSNADASRRE